MPKPSPHWLPTWHPRRQEGPLAGLSIRLEGSGKKPNKTRGHVVLRLTLRGLKNQNNRKTISTITKKKLEKVQSRSDVGKLRRVVL